MFSPLYRNSLLAKAARVRSIPVVPKLTVHKSMPNQHHPDKVCVSAWVPRTLARRIRKEAKRLRMSISDWVCLRFEQGVSHVELDEKDYRAIANEVAAAKRRTDLRLRENRPVERDSGVEQAPVPGRPRASGSSCSPRNAVEARQAGKGPKGADIRDRSDDSGQKRSGSVVRSNGSAGPSGTVRRKKSEIGTRTGK